MCIEYTHGAILTGEIAASVKPGTLGYCMAYHIRDGKLDRVHEYINSPSVRMSLPDTRWNEVFALAINEETIEGNRRGRQFGRKHQRIVIML